MNIEINEVDKLREDLVNVSKRVYNRGLTAGISGNISARVPSCYNQILIKASGKCLGDVSEDDFLRVDLDGNVIEGSGRPSIEVLFHCGIYKVRSEVNGIVHGHSPYSIAYVVAKAQLPVVTVAAEVEFSKIGIVDYAEPGSEKLAQNMIKVFEDTSVKAAFIKGHGFVTVGQDIINAYYLADVLEDNFKVACLIDLLSKN